MTKNIDVKKPGNQWQKHQVVSQAEWIAARKNLLKREKESIRLLDELSAERRKLPWVEIDKNYIFHGPSGKVTLAELFAGRSQLVIYHFMFGPDWEEGCPSCSLVSDHFDGTLPHLAARDVTLVAVSRAPFAKLEAFKKRLGWHFNWVSSNGSDFNTDFHVSFAKEEVESGNVHYNYGITDHPSTEAPGLSVFYKDAEGRVFHTYSTFSRGLDLFMTTYRILDTVPKGRDEDQFGFSMEWVRYHDRYGTNQFADAEKPYWPTAELASSPACECATTGARA